MEINDQGTPINITEEDIQKLKEELSKIRYDRLNAPINPNPLQGWVCPKCGAVMSPFTTSCHNCTGNYNNPYFTPQYPSNPIWVTPQPMPYPYYPTIIY